MVQSGRPIALVVDELGVNEGTLGNWVDRQKHEHPDKEEPLTAAGRTRVREVADETCWLRLENGSWKKAAAVFFAKAYPQSSPAC